MKPLYQNDCRTLSAALETIYSTISVAQFPFGVLSAVRKVFSCNTICYNKLSLPDSRLSWITEPADALPEPNLREMFNRRIQEHPLIAHSGPTGDGRSHRISDYLSQQQFHNLGLYNEYYRPLSVEYQLGTTISVSADQIIAVALDRDGLDFSDSECLSLDLLRPHLIRAYRNVQTLDLMKGAIESNGKTLLMVSRSGEVGLASDDAWRMIARFFDVSRFQKRLPEMLNSWIACEKSRFGNESDVPSPSLPLVVSKDGRRLTVHFIWGGKTAEQDMFLLEEEPAVYQTELPDKSGLTRREEEILAWLAQGRTNTEIGLALSISPRTVKKHLENIYEKLQVHGRGTAVARFYNL